MRMYSVIVSSDCFTLYFLGPRCEKEHKTCFRADEESGSQGKIELISYHRISILAANNNGLQLLHKI